MCVMDVCWVLSMHIIQISQSIKSNPLHTSIIMTMANGRRMWKGSRRWPWKGSLLHSLSNEAEDSHFEQRLIANQWRGTWLWFPRSSNTKWKHFSDIGSKSNTFKTGMIRNTLNNLSLWLWEGSFCSRLCADWKTITESRFIQTMDAPLCRIPSCL